MRRKYVRFWVGIMIALTLVLSGCGQRNTAAEKSPVDYGQSENWAYDGIGTGKKADLFLLCPTATIGDIGGYNMSLDDTETKKSFLGSLNMERGLYEKSTRMFAPYYRQASMTVYDLEPEEREAYLEIAYKDVSAAFSYYLEHENKGRPIIIAGFSQGADMCYRLLEEYFDDNALSEQLIAVYAIGWPCTKEMVEEYPQIKPAQSADDVGVVVSFDCEAPELTETFINPAGQKAYAINPLNWRTDSSPAKKKKNLGTCLTDYSGAIVSETAGLCGCYLDEERGVVKVTDLDPAEYPPYVPGLPEGAYHVYDCQFFYRNLQKNVRVRINSYLSAKEQGSAA